MIMKLTLSFLCYSERTEEGEHNENRPPPKGKNNVMLPLLSRHHLHRSTVAQHLADPGGNLRSIIAYTDEGICTQLLGVLDHQLVGVAAGPFAQVGIECDVATGKLLECSADVADDAA